MDVLGAKTAGRLLAPLAIPMFLTLSVALAGLAGEKPASRRRPHKPARATYSGVLTYHNDRARTGQNLTETILTPANVNVRDFGRLYTYQVDGAVFAQPLYVKGLHIPGLGVRNAVYVATEHDTVYAFDADGRPPEPLWVANLANAVVGATPLRATSFRLAVLGNEIGITGTPVIDALTGTLYVVALTNEKGKIVYRLHALDIRTGKERLKGGVTIRASVHGKGAGNEGTGSVVFSAPQQLQRPGLLLWKNVVYVGFASYSDTDPYHGWLLGYSARTLKQVSVFCTTPNGSEGAIWQAGAAPATDGRGDIFLAIGNGTFDASRGGDDYGESILKLRPTKRGLRVLDYFVPSNWRYLNQQDYDVGSGGVVLLPRRQPAPGPLLVEIGKSGTMFVLSRARMGKVGGSGHLLQTISLNLLTLSTPAYWYGHIYVQPAHGRLREFVLRSGRLSLTATSTLKAGYAGATPAVSSNGRSDGIVWVADTDATDPRERMVLRAFDAMNVSRELYDSGQAGTRDLPGLSYPSRFVVPTVYGGRVYVAAGKELDIYGLLGAARPDRPAN